MNNYVVYNIVPMNENKGIMEYFKTVKKSQVRK